MKKLYGLKKLFLKNLNEKKYSKNNCDYSISCNGYYFAPAFIISTLN